MKITVGKLKRLIREAVDMSDLQSKYPEAFTPQAQDELPPVGSWEFYEENGKLRATYGSGTVFKWDGTRWRPAKQLR